VFTWTGATACNFLTLASFLTVSGSVGAGTATRPGAQATVTLADKLPIFRNR